MVWVEAFVSMLAYKKSIQPQQKRCSLNLKNGFLKVFFLTQGITGEPPKTRDSEMYIKN